MIGSAAGPVKQQVRRCCNTLALQECMVSLRRTRATGRDGQSRCAWQLRDRMNKLWRSVSDQHVVSTAAASRNRPRSHSWHRATTKAPCHTS